MITQKALEGHRNRKYNENDLTLEQMQSVAENRNTEITEAVNSLLEGIYGIDYQQAIDIDLNSIAEQLLGTLLKAIPVGIYLPRVTKEEEGWFLDDSILKTSC